MAPFYFLNMATVLDLIKNLNSLNFEEIAQGIIKDDSLVILNLQKEQLMSGQDNEGGLLSPSYFEDPFFKTVEAAQAYSNWKDKITPPIATKAYPARPRGTPNLFINGYWQSGIDFISGLFKNSSELNSKIDSKYPNSLGINKTGISYYREFYFDEKFFEKIHNSTGL